MPAGPKYTGFGGYGPWPDNDLPLEQDDPSPHYPDGYKNRAPGGHMEAGSDIWLDALVYPNRLMPVSRAEADRLDMKGRNYTISVGNVTGKNPGPED